MTPAAADIDLAASALRVAEKYNGVTEHPAGSNRGPQVDVFQKAGPLPPGHAWCCDFAWCYSYGKALGHPVPYLTASVGALLDYARRHGWLLPIADAVPGALLCFEFSGDRWPDHVGLARAKPAHGKILTIEGNTSFDGHGSQSNGGCVAHKERDLHLVESGVCILPRGLLPAPPPPKAPPSKPKHVIVGKPGTKDARVYTAVQFAKLEQHGIYAVRRANGLVYYERR